MIAKHSDVIKLIYVANINFDFEEPLDFEDAKKKRAPPKKSLQCINDVNFKYKATTGKENSHKKIGLHTSKEKKKFNPKEFRLMHGIYYNRYHKEAFKGNI